MSSDRGYTRFFAYLNFFVFSMLLLVLAGNLALLIVGWAFVGAASYMLISYWYRRTTATSAGIKAFVINVVGDVGLVLGTFFIFREMGVLDYGAAVRRRAGGVPEERRRRSSPACLLILVGAFAKSAQVPLHTWLPDAMEGPTPVSSLIHAATMVTAGVYLIGRLHPLFEWAPTAADVGAIVGAMTLLIAGTIGLVVTDLKRVIAYSTMSQIGYMIMGVSAAAYVGGFFHLMTHAFFKALLFMAAGSLISAMGGEQSLDRMRGFRKAMPFTFACFVARRPRAQRVPADVGLLLEGRDPVRDRPARRLVLRLYVGRLHRRVLHRPLHVADDLPRVLGRAVRGGRRARARPPLPRAAPDEPGDGRDRGHRRRLPRRRAPHRRAHLADAGRDGRARRARGHRRRRLPAVRDHASGCSRRSSSRRSPTRSSQHPANDGLETLRPRAHVASSRSAASCRRLPDLGASATGRATAWQARFPALHRLFVNKWYFDELIGLLIVRPFAWFGRWARDTFERIVVNGALSAARAASCAPAPPPCARCRPASLRSYAGLVVAGLVRRPPLPAGEGRMTIHLSIVLWLPLATGAARAR